MIFSPALPAGVAALRRAVGSGADTLLAAARAAEDLSALVRATGASRPAAALALMIRLAEAGRPAEALRYAGTLAPLMADAAVLRFLAALEEDAPPLAPGTVFRDAAGEPVVFVVSYPRSGSTRFLAAMDAAFPRSRHAIYPGDGRYLSLKSPTLAARTVFVKAHELREEFAANPVIYLVRDGRDVLLSLCDFKLRTARAGGAPVDPAAANGLRPFLAGLGQRERFGLWPDHVAAALAARAAGRRLILLRYEDASGPDASAAMAKALAGTDRTLTPEMFGTGIAAAQKFEERLRAARPEWSREKIYPDGSLMARWLARGAGGWRELLSGDDKRALHEAGMTPALIAAGYETDPDWWRAS